MQILPGVVVQIVSNKGSLARVGDWLYYAGAYWRRLNLRTGTEELLIDNPRQLPNYGSGNSWLIANSTQYGLVAFCGGTIYRVTLDGEGIH